MKEAIRTPAGAILSSASLDLFRVTSRILAVGDRLVAELGLTSARWQLLGTIKTMERPETVAGLAREMGLNRQSIQRIVNEMAGDGFIELHPNPQHRRAPLVVLSAAGQRAFEAAMKLEAPWMDDIARGISVADLLAMHRVLKQLREQLRDDGGLSSQPEGKGAAPRTR